MSRHLPFVLLVSVAVGGVGCIGGPDAGSSRGSLQQVPEQDVHEGQQGEPDERVCSRTQGYWKNHVEAWQVDSLELGAEVYDQTELLVIFRTPVRGNGLVSLAHQLIAAKLNIAAGVSPLLGGSLDRADALIGELVIPPFGDGSLPTSETSELVGTFDAFNNGEMSGLCHDE